MLNNVRRYLRSTYSSKAISIVEWQFPIKFVLSGYKFITKIYLDGLAFFSYVTFWEKYICFVSGIHESDNLNEITLSLQGYQVILSIEVIHVKQNIFSMNLQTKSLYKFYPCAAFSIVTELYDKYVTYTE